MLLTDILKAKTWTEVLQVTKVENSRAGYKALMRKVHPDANRDPLATKASAHVNHLWSTRGTNKSTVPIVLQETGGVVLMQTGTGSLLNSMQYPDDSDLYTAYVKALGAFRDLPPFYPRYVQRHQDRSASRMAAEVRLEPGTWWLLSDFEELNTRDVVWIGKRVFTALLLAHKKKIAHGNVHDAVIWVLPDEHGLTLDGWWSSVPVGERLKVRPVHHRALQATKHGSSGFDVRAASTSLLDHMGSEDGPVKRQLMDLSRTGNTAQDALNSLDAAAREEFGEPAFHDMKTRSATRPDGIRVKSA